VVVFSAALDEDAPLVADEKQRGRVRARAFDLVLNGVELASAYIGNHSLAAQRLIWSNLFKINTQDLFRLRAPIEAHRFAVPPHGGMNIGFDRLVATLLGIEAIDEVMAFPKTPGCKDPMLESPGPVPAAAIQDLVDEHPRPEGATIAALSEETANL
jgi:aspartyl-tRNA synthetase